MQINVADLKNNVGASKNYTVNEQMPNLNVLGEEVKFTQPVTGTVKASNNGNGIEIAGRIRTEVVVHCSRCLREITLPLVADVAELYQEEVATEDLKQGQEQDQEKQEKEIGAALFQGDEIDLTDLLQETLLLALPIKPLCQEECRGLCPICGQDLNQALCDCKEERVDPRFAVLKQLLEK